MYHIRSFLLGDADTRLQSWKLGPAAMAAQPCIESDYPSTAAYISAQQEYASALQSAHDDIVKKKVWPEGLTATQIKERQVSQHIKPGLVSSRERACLDVASAVAARKCAASSDSHAVVDSSQSMHRMLATIRTDGSVSTYTTSTSIFDFNQNRYWVPEEMWVVHGYPIDRLKIHSLSSNDARTLIGNSACLTVIGSAVLNQSNCS